MGRDLRFDPGQGEPFLKRIMKVILSRGTFQCPDVLAHQCLAARQQTEAVFQVAADSEHRNRRFDRDGERAWRGAAAEPDWQGRGPAAQTLSSQR